MPGVGIGIILLNENEEVLLLLRNSDPKIADSDMRLEGLWTLPSGKVKLNETLTSAAIRKVKEETNLDISDVEVVSIADDINEYAHFVTIGVVAKQVTGNVQLQSNMEHVSYGYYDLESLPENLCESSKKIIRNYLENKIYRDEEK